MRPVLLWDDYELGGIQTWVVPYMRLVWIKPYHGKDCDRVYHAGGKHKKSSCSSLKNLIDPKDAVMFGVLTRLTRPKPVHCYAPCDRFPSTMLLLYQMAKLAIFTFWRRVFRTTITKTRRQEKICFI